MLNEVTIEKLATHLESLKIPTTDEVGACIGFSKKGSTQQDQNQNRVSDWLHLTIMTNQKPASDVNHQLGCDLNQTFFVY